MKHIDKKLTDDEFNQAVKLVRMNQKGQSAARRVMVDGVTRRKSAEEFGYSTGQAVQLVVDRIWNKHLEISGAFPGWTSVRVYLPEAKADEIKTMADQLRAEYINALR